MLHVTGRKMTSIPPQFLAFGSVCGKKREPWPAFAGQGSLALAMSYSRTTLRCTTIGAAAFHFRVRNGNGWCHCAMITRRLVKPKSARGGKFWGTVLPQLHQKIWRFYKFDL